MAEVMRKMQSDIVDNPSVWFTFFSNNNPAGMDKSQVIHALSSTFVGVDKHTAAVFVDALWGQIDPDGSGRISMREFLGPGGLREMILAQFYQKVSSAAPSRPQIASNTEKRIQCGMCQSQFAALMPANANDVLVTCPTCGSANQISVRPPEPVSGNFPNTSQHQKTSGRRKALLIGINYYGTSAELRGCCNDVDNMRKLLTQVFGWSQNCIHSLVDDGSTAMPTKAKMLEEMRWLARDAQPGDVLFFHFSGHGSQIEDPQGYEEDGMNETILPGWANHQNIAAFPFHLTLENV